MLVDLNFFCRLTKQLVDIVFNLYLSIMLGVNEGFPHHQAVQERGQPDHLLQRQEDTGG